MNEQKLKLSEAIRLGCKIAPRKMTKQYFSESKKSACAFGAALLGIGCDETCLSDNTFDELFGYSVDRTLPDPTGHASYDSRVSSTITYLNDVAKWTRERIADWLESEGL